MSCLTTGAPCTRVEKFFSPCLLAPLDGWRGIEGVLHGWMGSEKVPQETFPCHLPEQLALCWLGWGKSWGGCPGQWMCWNITEPRGSFHLRDAPRTSILTSLQLQQCLLQSPRQKYFLHHIIVQFLFHLSSSLLNQFSLNVFFSLFH